MRSYNGLLVLSFYNSSPTHKGSINQEPSSVRGPFGALPLRPTAMIRRTSHEVLLYASDGWCCRVDVVRVGADLRVRPQGVQRSKFQRGRADTQVRPYKGLHVLLSYHN